MTYSRIVGRHTGRESRKTEKWWRPIEEILGETHPRGLKVQCPRCQGNGFVITRWIKGPGPKPLYVLHMRQGKIERICELSEKQANSIRGAVSVFRSDIVRILRVMKPFVLFSGGKDSLATLVYLKNIARNANRQLTAIYVDTTVGLRQNTAYVRRVCRYLGVNLKIVRPKVDYFTLAKRWGIPSFGYRWCCRELKIKPIQRYLRDVKGPKVVLDGIRASESSIRKQYIPIWYHPSFRCLSVSPIFHWSEEKLASFINNNGIPRTILHSVGTSTECWCGAYKTEADFKKLYGLDKGMFRKLSGIEVGNKNRYTFLYKNGQKLPLKDLEQRILAVQKD